MAESSATGWYRDSSKRGGPNSPKDFDLFKIPRYSADEWSRRVSADPRQVLCTVVSIAKVGDVTPVLFKAVASDHGVSTAEAVEIFDEYLGAACPKCFGGLTGHVLQMVSAGSHMAGLIGGGVRFQRVLRGQCANCESDTYHIVWFGDRTHAIQVGGYRSPAPEPPQKKWWQFWKQP